jgi:curved DNA-binding protein CbpA
MPFYSKLTPELSKQICSAAEHGMPQEVIAEAAGIHPDTLANWLRWGREGKEPYAEFFRSYKESEWKWSLAVFKRVDKSRDWKAQQFLLKHKYPKAYQDDKTHVNVILSNDKPLDDNEIKQMQNRIAELMSKLTTDTDKQDK